MRNTLDTLYRLSGGLAAFFLAAICAIVMAQVGANIIDTIAVAVGAEPFGLVVPAYAEFTGFFLVAATFLALANTLRAGSHIRVTLLIRGLGPAPKRWAEIWCTAVGFAFSAYFSWHAVWMVSDSYTFNDVSAGIVPVPLWIPQSPMAIGLIILTIALADEFVTVLKGRPPAYAKGDEGLLSDFTPEDAAADVRERP
ncbi:MAG: TRAP transporter small permease [Rhodospirillales bacterium]|nr:TRAP transporter small permease [Rhodospirillales bacterium]